jgi:hypothetical protein
MSTCMQCGGAVTAAEKFCTQCGAGIKQTSRPDGGSSVYDGPAGDPPGSRGSGTPVSQSISAVLPQWGQVTRSGWWLLGGVLLVFIGSLLPWAQTSVDGLSEASSHPGGGGVIIFLALAICTAVAGWPLLTGAPSKRRLLGTTVPVALLALFAITNWSDLNNVQHQAGAVSGGLVSVSVSAGSGLVLYTVGVVVLCALIVRLWLIRRRVVAAAV